MRFRLLGLAIGFCLQAVATAGAASPDVDGCNNQTNLDLKITYCNRVIQSGNYIGADAAWAFLERGVAYGKKGQYDGAMADFQEALRLKPDYALAFMNRGTAYFQAPVRPCPRRPRCSNPPRSPQCRRVQQSRGGV